MAEPATTQRAGPRTSPAWLKVLTIAILVIDASSIGFAFYFTMGKGVEPLEFYLLPAFVALLTGAPLALALRRGYLSTETVSVPQAKPALAPKKPAEEIGPGEERIGLRARMAAAVARPVNEGTRVKILAGSAMTALVLILVSTFVYPTYQVRPEYDNQMVVVLMIGLFPPSLVDFIDRRYRALVDSRIPDFLREIGESQRTGTPFATSLENAAQANYGPLSVELRKAVAKMSWGFTFEDALNSFASSANTPLSHRAAVLLNEVGRSGGKMLEVLDSVYEHIREVVNLQRERNKQLTPYIIVIYASFGVYLFVVYILFSTFFAQVASLQHSGAPFGSNINPSVYYIWFFHLSIIESVFGGLVAGKISTGSAVAGTKHMLFLLVIAFVTFTGFIKY